MNSNTLKDDVVGIGFRAEMAREIIDHLDSVGEIECLELIAEQHFHTPVQQLQGLKQLAKLVPIGIHGVSLGMASASKVELSRADGMARLCDAVQPIFWSEHLSFVRSGGAEIGHLAAPPRSQATVDGALDNIERVARHVGSMPLLENIATLISPPCSDMTEVQWLDAIVQGSGSHMLLDLHNLHTNAVNSGLDPFEMLNGIPLHRVREIHLAGGQEIPAPGGGVRVLDNHASDVPPIVFELLESVAARVHGPLMVILERDSRYPPIDELLADLRKARRALQRGRAQRESLSKRAEAALMVC